MTEFTLAGNPNYAARIIEVKNLVDLDGLDNLKGIPIDGFNALVQKDVNVGDILVVFPAESQIEDWFLKKYNLYRHSDLNFDPNQTGYIEDNRRVRAIKLRGHHSNALALDAAYVGATRADVGTLFDTVDGVLLSKKYELPLKGSPTQKGQRTSTFAKINLPEHIDTENYWRNSDKIGPDEFVTVTQKVHGTSVRYGRVPVPKVLSRWQRVLRWFGADVSDTEYAFVAGSRKVIKSVVRGTSAQTNDNASHFYATDLWSEEGQKYADLIPNGVVVFGELIGWTKDGAPIQQNYTYNVPKGEAHLYVYRVATMTPDGKLYDLSWNGVKQFAFERGLNVVPELWSGKHEDFDADNYIDIRFTDETLTAYEGPLPLSDKKTVDEGVVVRKEGITPYVLKAKSPIFLGHESKLLDAEVVDLESEESHVE
jgi:hypothetical protein